MRSEKQRWVLSGGLASGKSKVRDFLEGHGVQTIDADSVGHAVLEPDGPAYAEAVERWPHVVRNGEIHRPSLASIVFSDTSELVALEGITHPHIFDMINVRLEGVESSVVVEIPLLSHGLGDDWKRMVVDCHDEIRIQRALERGMSPEDAEKRLRAQPERAEWLSVADVVIPNHGSIGDLDEVVARLAVNLFG
ncbi:MAG TPA: dephospho-CoA kinase [Acidimicrobiia bacterium]|nr:dephospho-CoA kinase [Acidimicrobiia bacterium]